jgi:OOP family OmpA-OmpF porin
MPESLFSSLLHSLDKNNISQIATSTGESERGIFRGLEACIASVLGAMTGKADDPNALRGMLDLVPESAGEISWPKLITGLTTPGGSLIAKGRQMLSNVFGSNSTAVANAVSKDSGISEGTGMTLLAMATPMVLRFLDRRVLDEGWSMKTLGSFLQRESATIRGALPTGVSDLLWPRAATAAASPVIAQSMHRERTSSAWVSALGLTVLALGALWFLSHLRRPSTEVTGEASRAANESYDYVTRKPAPNTNLNVPANGVESRLIGIIKGTIPASRTTWLTLDGLMFDSGKSTLRAGSAEQLDNVAAILKAYPNVRIAIAGFTDNVGNAGANLQLSRARAQAVKDALTSRGISADRLMAEGFGEHAALASNADPNGRAMNRRVSLQVTQR